MVHLKRHQDVTYSSRRWAEILPSVLTWEKKLEDMIVLMKSLARAPNSEKLSAQSDKLLQPPQANHFQPTNF